MHRGKGEGKGEGWGQVGSGGVGWCRNSAEKRTLPATKEIHCVNADDLSLPGKRTSFFAH